MLINKKMIVQSYQRGPDRSNDELRLSL